MRLTTLARKIDKTPSQLIAYLTEKNIEIPNGIHSKLEKEVADAVLSDFLPDEQEIIAEDEVVAEEHPIQEEMLKEEHESSVEEDTAKTDIMDAEENKPEAIEIAEVPKTATIEDLESEHFEEVDLIKAKKVKLEGIKVVGKIDLPEKPKKVEAEVPEEKAVEENDKSTTKKESRKFDRNRKKNKKNQKGKYITYEERLKEEEREKLKQRRRRENSERKRKQKFYEENIKPKHIQKQKSKKQQKLKEKSPVAEKEVIVHKNPIKRLWAWLNGEYDKY